MKSTPLTQGVSMLILAVYILYGFFALPFAGFILSFATGLLSYGLSESFEISVSSIILTGVMFSLIAKAYSTTAPSPSSTNLPSKNKKEGFTSAGADNFDEIKNRVKDAKGVFASGFAEGFANPNTDEPPTQQTTEAASKPTPVNDIATIGAGSGITPPKPSAVAKAVKTVSGFKDTEGDLPSEEKEGFHIDQGTTVMNALNALKPDQITAMSQDTQKLIDTQKSLMGMLSTMKPMLQDGKQMMDTFQQMFGQTNGVTGTSPPINLKL